MVLIANQPIRAPFQLKDYLFALYGLFCAGILYQVRQKITYPFIDEIFHITQCQAYCAYKFSQWDPKITTPPGLYVLAASYAKSSLIFGTDYCQDLTVLRSINMFAGLQVLPKVLELFLVFDPNQFWAVNIVSQPLLSSFYFFFYTDVWSTVLVVASLGLVLRIPLTNSTAHFSGLIGFLSLWFRQTNIIWIAFILSVMVDRRVEIERDQVVSYPEHVLLFLTQLVKDYKKAISFILNFVAFAAFLKINGGITLGDKSNHQVVIHIVQAFYCFTFIAFFTWPVWLSLKTILEYKSFLFGSVVKVILNAIAFVAIWVVIDRFTVVHIFLLSDNRHYTFYIYRKILSNKYSPIFAIPLYHFATWVIVSTLSKSKRLALSPITITTFIGATCLTLIPSPLFEPRYYIIPLIIFRLFIKPVDKNRSLLEFIWLSSINVIVFLIFFNYEFKWESEGDIPQRIFW